MNIPPIKQKIDKNITHTLNHINQFEKACTELKAYAEKLKERNMPLTSLETYKLDVFVEKTINSTRIIEKALDGLKMDFTKYTKTAFAKRPENSILIMQIVNSIHQLEYKYGQIHLPELSTLPKEKA